MSFKDYPKAARQKAKSAINRNTKNGNRCATQVGKVRAQQLAQGKPLSLETVKRTYSYLSRGQAYRDPDNPNSCGSISYDLWGGDAMLAYTRKVLKKK
jgi:hypothetical protein